MVEVSRVRIRLMGYSIKGELLTKSYLTIRVKSEIAGRISNETITKMA